MQHITVKTLNELEQHGPVWTYYHLSISAACARFVSEFGHEPDVVLTLADTVLPSPVYCVIMPEDLPSARLEQWSADNEM